MNSTLNGKLHNVNIDLIFKNKCSNMNSIYYVLNLGSKTLIKIDKDRFKSIEAPIITFKQYKVKYKGIEKQLALNILKNYFVNFEKNKYSPESFEGEGLLDYLLKVKQLVSSLSNVPSAISDVFASVITQVLYLKDLGSNLWNKLFLMELVQLFASLFSLMEPRLTTFKSNVLDIGDILLKIYKLFLYVKEGIKFGAESIGDLLSLGAACILPAPLMELFRKASTLSNMKIMDDASIFFELFDTVLNFIKVILESLPVSVSSFLNPFLEKLTIKGRFVMLHKAKSLLKKYRKNKLQIAESYIREEWKKEVDEILTDTGLLEWKRYSNLVSVILSDINELKKNIDVYDKSSRQEPTCFIFEGHAGCMKSCSLNAVVQVLNKSSYSHLSKGLMDGKNWYDRYNNEYIFYQDDMGQQGISQWRNLMNYVSPVKMPLDCADSKLKDTKFFNSNILLFSTNNFMNIQGLTRGDGIESLEALHRRGMVFDFYGVQRSFGAIAGIVKFQYFDTQDHKKFINKFPPEFEKYIKDNSVQIQPFFNCDGNNYHQLIAWMCTIIENFDCMKQEIYKNSEMSSATLKEIRNMILKPKRDEIFIDATETFEPESLEEFYNSFKEVVNYCVSEAIEGLNNLKSIMSSNPQLYITTVVVLLSIWSKAYFQKFEPEAGEVLENIIKSSKLTVESTAAQFISRQTYFCNLHFNKSNMESCCLVSGHFVLLNSHAVKEEQGFITIYQHHSKNHRLLDHVPFSVYFRSNNDDVCIISIPDKIHSPFKKLDHLLNAAGF